MNLRRVVVESVIKIYIAELVNKGYGSTVTVRFRDVYKAVQGFYRNVNVNEFEVRNYYVAVVKSFSDCIEDWKKGRVVFNRGCLRDKLLALM